MEPSNKPVIGEGPYARDTAFWGITITQFLGAFNDNLFKQTLLLLFVTAPVAGGGSRDLQGVATLVFSLPFIFFSGYAGHLSDRFGKAGVIFLSKVGEIVIMAAGMGAFYWYAFAGLSTPVLILLNVILFAMASQSAFFGPGKYGILPELFRESDLPGANGFILMTTFLAIIFGSALAGELKQSFAGSLYIVGGVCVLIAIVGTATSLLIRRPPPAQPEISFSRGSLFIPKEIRQLLRVDREMRNAIVVSSIFWLTAAMVQMIVNSLGKNQLEVSDRQTSIMVATISAGIAVGSVLAGFISKHHFSPRVMRTGAWGMIVCLALLAIPMDNPQSHFLGYSGSVVVLVVLGGFTGLFAVPLQVFMQSRPPSELKGRMIATQNLLNWVGISMAAILYDRIERTITHLNWPKCAMFAVTATFILSIAIWYHPSQDVHAGQPDSEPA